MVGLPLFPLTLVLFPGALTPLHIFEPRYRRLLADAAEGDHRFVILPPGPSGGAPEPGTVGTIALIRAIQPLPDGRSNVVVSGQERVALTAVLASDTPYLVGETERLPDRLEIQVPTPADQNAMREQAERYAAALATISDLVPEAELSNDPAEQTFQIAALLEWDFETKRSFLAIRSARERVTRLLAALPELVQDIEARAATHEKARTNGHGTHH